MKVLHLDVNHPLIIEQFNALGFQNDEDYTSSKEQIEKKIDQYDGIIIRSRFTIDEAFLDKATNLKFIGRLGAGLENIDTDHAKRLGIFLAAAPEGNRNAVGEHALGMILSLFNKLNKADKEVRDGKWDREGNRGLELDGKTVGIIGYGNMGKAFAKKLKGFDVEVICYDIVGGVEDENARQVGIMELKQKAEILSLHVPQTASTTNMINSDFLKDFKKPLWLINTARGKYEKKSFEDMFSGSALPEAFNYLVNAENVLLTPHVAGWTVESKIKLAQTVVDKIRRKFC
jgi:D-3-phosphoglycerate dehydrogenase